MYLYMWRTKYFRQSWTWFFLVCLFSQDPYLQILAQNCRFLRKGIHCWFSCGVRRLVIEKQFPQMLHLSSEWISGIMSTSPSPKSPFQLQSLKPCSHQKRSFSASFSQTLAPISRYFQVVFDNILKTFLVGFVSVAFYQEWVRLKTVDLSSSIHLTWPDLTWPAQRSWLWINSFLTLGALLRLRKTAFGVKDTPKSLFMKSLLIWWRIAI